MVSWLGRCPRCGGNTQCGEGLSAQVVYGIDGVIWDGDIGEEHASGRSRASGKPTSACPTKNAAVAGGASASAMLTVTMTPRGALGRRRPARRQTDPVTRAAPVGCRHGLRVSRLRGFGHPRYGEHFFQVADGSGLQQHGAPLPPERH